MLGMTTIDEGCSSSGNIPDLYGGVVAGGCYVDAISLPYYLITCYYLSPGQGADRVPREGAASNGRPRESLYALGMTAIASVSGGDLSGGGVPDLYGF